MASTLLPMEIFVESDEMFTLCYPSQDRLVPVFKFLVQMGGRHKRNSRTRSRCGFYRVWSANAQWRKLGVIFRVFAALANLVGLLGMARVLRADSGSTFAADFENLFRIFHIECIDQNLVDVIDEHDF